MGGVQVCRLFNQKAQAASPKTPRETTRSINFKVNTFTIKMGPMKPTQNPKHFDNHSKPEYNENPTNSQVAHI